MSDFKKIFQEQLKKLERKIASMRKQDKSLTRDGALLKIADEIKEDAKNRVPRRIITKAAGCSCEMNFGILPRPGNATVTWSRSPLRHIALRAGYHHPEGN